MEDFTYGRRISRNGGHSQVVSSMKLKLQRLEEKRQSRLTLKILHEKKASSICGSRDPCMLEKQAEMNGTVARAPFEPTTFTDVDVMEMEIEFKR
jgi:hypothetical protein